MLQFGYCSTSTTTERARRFSSQPWFFFLDGPRGEGSRAWRRRRLLLRRIGRGKHAQGGRERRFCFCDSWCPSRDETLYVAENTSKKKRTPTKNRFFSVSSLQEVTFFCFRLEKEETEGRNRKKAAPFLSIPPALSLTHFFPNATILASSPFDASSARMSAPPTNSPPI